MRWKLLVWLLVQFLAYTSAIEILRKDSLNEVTTKKKEVDHGINYGIHVENPVETRVEDDNEEAIEVDVSEDTSEEDNKESFEDEETRIVETAHGRVQGFMHSSHNLLAYMDIPYGSIDGIFQAPTEPVPWGDEIHNVSNHNKHCPQLDYDDRVTGDLDCLTLSIFTPLDAANVSVLFHIHDGNFHSGSGDPAVYGPELIVPKGIILVLPNYRLGPLGFLCLENEKVPGNAGLKDLTLALNWVANNIAAFGGDPTNIVASGEGLAGILVGYLAISPMSSMYISKAITESGSMLSHMALDRDPINTALKIVAAKTNITDPTTVDLDVIIDMDIQELIESSKNIKLRPCVENTANAFMNATPWKTLRSVSVNKTFMIGSASLAGIHDPQQLTPEAVVEMNEDPSQLLPGDLWFHTEAEKHRAGASIKQQYFEDGNITAEEVEKLALYYTDLSYIGPAIRTARHLIDADATVFFYEFSFVGQLDREVIALSIQHGAAKGVIVGYIFARNGEIPEAETLEGQMVDVMTDLWVSFVKTGEPTSDGVLWKKLQTLSESEEEWLSILDPSNVTLHRGLHVNRLALWTQLYRDHFVDSSNTGSHISSSYLDLGFAITILFGLQSRLWSSKIF